MDARRLAFFLGLAIAFLPHSGCEVGYIHSHCIAQLATPSGPVVVEANADVASSIASKVQDNDATVIFSFGNHRQVVINPSGVEVDGVQTYDLPPDIKKISIEVKRGQLTMLADGQALPETPKPTAEAE